MNKAELIEALTVRLGDRRTATQALDAVLAEIQAAVTKGDRVAITGFGAFEKRVRGPRTARNPRTGESVKVKKTSVPAFKAGAGFKEMVASGKVPKTAAKKTTAAAKATTSRAAGTKATATRATKSPASKATVTKSAAKAAPAKAATKKAPAKKAPAKAAKTTAAAKTTGRTTATAKAAKAAKATTATTAKTAKTARKTVAKKR